MRKPLLAVTLAATVAFAACGSSGSSKTQQQQSTTTTVKLEPAGINPSTSAKQICNEAITDLDKDVGESPTSVSTPTWDPNTHVYSCTLTYPQGIVTMSVKEMSSTQETDAYYKSLEQLLGRKAGQSEVALGQGAFITPTGSLVARKDWKVLTVDVSKMPETATVGQPPLDRGDLALTIGVTVMGCWTGA